MNNNTKIGEKVYIREIDVLNITDEDELLAYYEDNSGKVQLIECVVIRKISPDSTELYRHDLDKYEIWENSKILSFDETSEKYDMIKAIEVLVKYLKSQNMWDSDIISITKDYKKGFMFEVLVCTDHCCKHKKYTFDVTFDGLVERINA